MAQSGLSAAPARRLCVRLALLGAAPAAAALAGLRGGQLAFCVVSAALWGLLEASLARRLRFTAACRRIPFSLRLLGAFGLDVQACWFLAGEGLGEAPAGRPSRSDATLSVVLPCANESDFVLKTIRAVFEATPAAQLREIIVVDDASSPPISERIPRVELETHHAYIIRHDAAQGLIRSKKAGGDAAQGWAVAFLDCHVKPAQDWTRAILRHLQENPKRVVVPAITSLDPESWQELSASGGGRKMCLTWNADFTWCNDYPGPHVPIMSGGLLAMTKFWWDTIGGYDEEMRAWGGENLDQSLRTWLCGGEIVVADESRVAHMWRDPANPKTALHYAIPTEHVRRNRLRAAEAWLGPWAAKVRTFPEFEDFTEGGPLELGSLANILQYREKLQCKSFDWYLQRFQDLYLGTGMLPESVFNLQDGESQLCLQSEMSEGKSRSFSLAPCDRLSELQRFHAANAGPGGGCCSGLKLWDFDSCMAAGYRGGAVWAESCSAFGHAAGQQLQLSPEGLLGWHQGRGCVMPAARTPPAALGVALMACAAPDGAPKLGQAFARWDGQADGRFQLRSGEDACLGASGRPPALAVMSCGTAAAWWWHEAGQLRNAAIRLCLDANDMLRPILYPCYPPNENPKQRFVLHRNGWVELPRSWADNGRMHYPARCLDIRPVEPRGLEVADCGEPGRAGQRWQRRWPEVPLETRLFREAQGHRPGAVALRGGSGGAGAA